MTGPNIWIVFTPTGFYPIQPSPACKAEDHGRLNPHIERIEAYDGTVLWKREVIQ